MERYSMFKNKVIVNLTMMYCDTPEKLFSSELFKEVLARFFDRLKYRQSRFIEFITKNTPEGFSPLHYTISLLRLLTSYNAEGILEINNEYAPILTHKEIFYEFIEEFYNFWRRLERYLVLEAPRSSHYTSYSYHHAQFIRDNEELKHLILKVYRAICENLTGRNPRVYRQLPSGANIGVLIEPIDWDCPEAYGKLTNIPFIRLALMEPPLILYPTMNFREGVFEEIAFNPLENATIQEDEWFCYPARVGPLVAFVYFHRDFASLGMSLINLFEIADFEEIKDKRPDIIYIFGDDTPGLKERVAFYDDVKNSIVTGYASYSERHDYFGYLKKMTLTLHNLTMMKRGRLPLHGAMVAIRLKSGAEANIIMIGDSGAGKSETLEAFRVLSDEHISEMTVIFDDMGSIAIQNDRILGYGTEIGAFVRLDDLQPGYAFEEIDRSIFMNPHRNNARVIIPVTRYHNIVKGYPVNLFLYANNYEQPNEEDAVIEFIPDIDRALDVFRYGARLAKGTTDEKGLTHSYFANPFGAVQRKEIHENLAHQYFEKMFATGIKVGQIRTQLGIEGYELEGPKLAALKLFNVIQNLSK